MFKTIYVLVRDPISILKTFLNLNRRSINYIDELQFGFDIDIFLKNRIAYVDEIGKIDKPTLNAINRVLQDHGLSYYFHDDLSAKLFNVCNTHFIDMNEILGNMAYKTLCRLSDIFNIDKPNINDKEFYEHNFGEYNTWLPIKINLFNLIENDLIVIISDKHKMEYQNIDYVKLNKFLDLSNDKFLVLLKKDDQGVFFKSIDCFKNKFEKY
ncbi:DUF2972 domain-containing protein [Campylobacter estrildidarum]|uniref:Uncharacterized protein n=1 Tax=Campylobacter estrildidarum TaxID=2510189 RepID=A0A4U7BT49_9BACT|nr:DUF2972 domain-containing protein [Campylobacter estrildidarum]TKX32034.1 hypothetical protein CQA69_00530 [Campylobacter estrildidarum]